MRVLSLVGVAALALLISSCGNKPKDLIIGKWEATDDKDKGVVEFNKDGTFKITSGPFSMNGTYKFVDDNTIEMEMDNPLAGGVDMPSVPGGVKIDLPKKITTKSKVKVTKDELTMTELDKDGKEGKTTKGKRVK